MLDASESLIRGLAIEGFGVGVSIPEPTDVGDLIQGNASANTSSTRSTRTRASRYPLPTRSNLTGLGNTQRGFCSARPTRPSVAPSPRTPT